MKNPTLDPMQPTIIFDSRSSASLPGQNSNDVSQAQVGFVAGDRPHFSDETAALLRSRLTAAASVIAVVLAADIVGTFIGGITNLWWLRGLILIAVACAVVVLRTGASLSLLQLRTLELFVFGSALLQVSMMLVARLATFAADDDAISAASVRQQSLMAFSVLIFTYGTLMPNTWRRGAAVMISVAVIPYLLRQICGALQEAHSVGVIHRDIKPANIFASQRGGVYDVAKLLDFGLVKEGSDRQKGGAAKHGSFSGTPLYMSPEQASAYDDVDGRADIYSLGAVGYFLLTGQTPFTGKNVLELLAAHRNSDVIPPSRLAPAIHADLDRIILKCLAKEPSNRFQDAASLMDALDTCSVAQHWGAEQAANWWRSIGEAPIAST